MPPRYAYWTIIAGGLPTAFRMTVREELLPTFRCIKQKHPDAEMKYFARGRLWNSPDEARAEAEARRAATARRHSTWGAPSRGRDWRPGGEHQDPRQKFKDAKKLRTQDRRHERFERRHKSGTAAPPGDAPARPAPRGPRTEWRDRGARAGKPAAPGNRPWRDHAAHTGKPPASGRRPWNDRGPRAAKPAAPGDRPWRDRSPQENRAGGPRRDEPYRGKPKAGDDRKPATPRPKGSSGAPKASGARKPAPWPRPSRPKSRPPGLPGRDRNQRGPSKDRRRR